MKKTLLKVPEFVPNTLNTMSRLTKTVIDDEDDDEELLKNIDIAHAINYDKIKNKNGVQKPMHRDRMHANGDTKDLNHLAHATDGIKNKKKKLSSQAQRLLDIEAGVDGKEGNDDDDGPNTEDDDFINDDEDIDLAEFDDSEDEEDEEDGDDDFIEDEADEDVQQVFSEEEDEYVVNDEEEDDEDDDDDRGPSVLEYELDTIAEFESHEQLLTRDRIPNDTTGTLYRVVEVLLKVIARDYVFIEHGYQEDEDRPFFMPIAETGRQLIFKEKRMSNETEIRAYQTFHIVFLAPYITYIHKKFKGQLSESFDRFLRAVERTHYHVVREDQMHVCMVSGEQSDVELVLYVADPNDENSDQSKEVYKDTPFYISAAWWRWVRSILVLCHFYTVMLKEFDGIYTKNEIGIMIVNKEAIMVYINQEVYTLVMRFLYFIFPFFKKASILTSMFSKYKLGIGKE